jgi:hexosaminidase
VWHDASPMTAFDIHWLDDECIARGIELVPNQNCFGHMNRWLMHDAYRTRAECPDGAKAPWGADLPPWTLEPTPDNAAFVLELFDELLPNFHSRRVNIGCDEPFDLGQGKSADEIARRGKTAVYLEHLDRIARPLVERGYEVQVWGDVLEEDPALAAKVLPDGVVAVPWHYEQPWPNDLKAQIPSSTLDVLSRLDANPMDGFRPKLKPLVGLDMPFWVAPGTATWNSLVGRIDNAFGNLRDAAEQGLAFGARGYLITDWGDNGHHQPPSVSWGPLVYGGAVSWALEANRDLDVADVLDTFVFSDDESQLGEAVHRLGLAWRSTGQLAFNGSPIFRALVPRSTMSFGEIDGDRCTATVEMLDEALVHIASSSPACDDASTVRDELTAATRLARHGVWRMLRKAEATAPDDDAMRRDLSEAIELQRAAWLLRSRPGGLADSLGRLERTLAEYG